MHKSQLDQDRLLKTEDVAALFRVTTRSVQNLIAAGELPVVRPTKRSVRFLGRDIHAYIERRRTQARSSGKAAGPTSTA